MSEDVKIDWCPAPGEHLLLRSYAHFATGAAPLVDDRRWFRDTNRQDIQHELPGWPEGPTYTLSSDREQMTKDAVGCAFVLIPLILDIAVSLVSGMNSHFAHEPSDLGKSQDPENEVEDFPVMWADPGTIARTLPWQLDPDRCPRRRLRAYETEVAVTDRRLVVLGSWPGERKSVLWETPRRVVASAEVMKFSAGGRDIRITFIDFSWVRLRVWENARMANILNGRSWVIQESDLTPDQRNRVAEYLAAMRPREREIADPPVFTFLPSGTVLAEIAIRDKKSTVHTFFMGSDGKHQSPLPGDL